MRFIYTTLTILVFVFACRGQQQSDELFKLSLDELMNIEISSVSKTPESVLEAPQTIIVITQEEITERGYTDLEQILHDLPGFDISRGNGTQYSQIYQRGYRTKNTEKTLFMIDGVEENDLWSNSVWLSRQYPISNIKRIEVIYGPSSTIYGANAFLGVINIITKDPADYIKDNRNIGICAQAGYGTWNTSYADVSIAKQFAHDVSFSLTGRYFRSDEMDLSGYKDWNYNLEDYNLEYYLNTLETNNTEVAQIAMDMDNFAYYNDPELNGKAPGYSNNTNDYLIYGKLKIKDFKLGFQTFKRDEGYGAWYRDDYELGPENGGKWVPMNTFLYAKYDKEITSSLSITSFTRFKSHKLDGTCEEYYYIGYMNEEIGLNGLYDIENNVILPEDDRIQPYWYHGWFHTYSQQIRSELRANYNLNDNFKVVGGLEYRNSHIQGNYWVSTVPNPEDNGEASLSTGGNHYYIQDIGLFTQGSYKIMNDLKIVFGGRVDYNQIRDNGGYGTVFNPKLAVVYTPSNFIIKGIYSEAFVDAGSWTKYGTTPGRLLNNPNLEPEKVNNAEASFTYNISKNLFTNIVLYHSRINNAVRTANVSYTDENGDTIHTTQHQAFGKAEIAGIQSDIRYHINNYSLYFNYSYTYPYNTTNDKLRIGDIASHKFNLGVNAKYFNKLNINLRSNWVGEKPTGTGTTITRNPYNKIDSYFLLNGSVSYNIYKGFTIQISVNNIFDTEYFHPGVRSADGNYYAARMPQNRRNGIIKIIANF